MTLNKELRKIVSHIFEETGLKPVVKPHEDIIEFQKEVEGVAVAYPYSTMSDTLLRIVFYLTAIETNRDSIILFEEPEAHSFPYYTKYLAEKIALDKTNQYFISTHNPYFLLSVIEKASKQDVGIFLTYFENHCTKVKKLTSKQIQEFLEVDLDIFFNLDKYIPGKNKKKK